ncbi:MAG: hypothetical protein GEU74_14435 [Nitriliruptorales bacterium]|nr:hypothetical protein [Nitriliruptorales bacterium]
MTILTRTVVTIETTPGMLKHDVVHVHEALLDGDEGLAVGDEVLIHDGAGTYRAATVTSHDDDIWQLTLTRS